MPTFSDKIVIRQCNSQGKSTFEPKRECLQKHTIAETMAPSILDESFWTSVSNKSWRVKDFFDALARGIRATLGGRYLPSIFTSGYTFLSFVCELSPQWRSYLWKQNSAWSLAAGARVKTEMESTWNFGSNRLLVTVFLSVFITLNNRPP